LTRKHILESLKRKIHGYTILSSQRFRGTGGLYTAPSESGGCLPGPIGTGLTSGAKASPECHCMVSFGWSSRCRRNLLGLAPIPRHFDSQKLACKTICPQHGKTAACCPTWSIEGMLAYGSHAI